MEIKNVLNVRLTIICSIIHIIVIATIISNKISWFIFSLATNENEN